MNYTKFHNKCSEIEAKFGGTRDTKIRTCIDTSIFDKSKSLLEIGAGKSYTFKQVCDDYYTLDTDTDLDVTWHDIFLIDRKFDYIIANQVLEHVKKSLLEQTVKEWCDLLKKDGIILITLPNIQYWMKQIGDFDHKHPMAYFHAGAFLELCGSVEIIDVYKYGKRVNAIQNANETEQFLFAFMSKWFELDPFDFITIIARKK